MTSLLMVGPTPERVLHAIPGLAVVGGAVVARAISNQVVEWVRSRLASRLRLIASLRILELATDVDLLAYDDRKYCDALHLIRERAPESLATLLFSGIRVVSGVIGLAISATVVVVLNPLLLVLLPLAVLPDW